MCIIAEIGQVHEESPVMVNSYIYAIDFQMYTGQTCFSC